MIKKTILAATLMLSAVLAASVAGAADDSYGSEYKGYERVSTVSYSDVPETFWAHDSIVRVSEMQWFSGYPDGTFRPNAPISRAEALKVMTVFQGISVKPVTQSSYPDVSIDEWYSPYIEAGKGLIPVREVMGETPFLPYQPITREDTVYALVKIKGLEDATVNADQSPLLMFSDYIGISDSIKPYVAVAITNKLVSGFEDSTFRAQTPLTRAEFATLLSKASKHGYE